MQAWLIVRRVTGQLFERGLLGGAAAVVQRAGRKKQNPGFQGHACTPSDASIVSSRIPYGQHGGHGIQFRYDIVNAFGPAVAYLQVWRAQAVYGIANQGDATPTFHEQKNMLAAKETELLLGSGKTEERHVGTGVASPRR